MLKYFYTLLFLLCNSIFCWTQTEEIQIKVYGFEEGLSHRNVFKIQQDEKGFIWLATFNGLNRFDGVQFEAFDFLPNGNKNTPFISDMCIDTLGNIYTLVNQNIYQFHPDKQLKKAFQSSSSQSTLPPSQLFLDQNQKLWYSSFSSEGSHNVLNNPYDTLGHKTLRGNYPRKPFAQNKNTYYTSEKNNQILAFRINEKTAKKYKLPIKNRISDLFVDTQNQVWILTEQGQVFYLKDGLLLPHEISSQFKSGRQNLSSILVEDNGDIWLAGFSNLWHFDNTAKKMTNYNNRIRQITKNAVNYRQLYQDRQGLIWVASDFGAIKISKSNQLFQNYLHEGSEYCANGVCSMRGITGDGNNRVFFAYYNSIHQLNTKTDEIRPLFRAFPFYNSPFGILYHKEKLYIGNGRKIDLQTMKIDTLFQGEATDKGVLSFDKDSLLWMGYEKEIHLFDQADQSVPVDTLSGILDSIKSDINYLYQGKTNDYFWIATNEHGLLRYSKNTSEIKTIHTKNSELNNNRILALYEDNQQRLWIGTANGLHFLHIPSGKISVKTTEEGLTNNFINGLLSEGDTCVWVSTDNGLSRYCVADDSFTNYYQKDGLSSNEFNRISFYQSLDGRLYFGGLNGVNAFYPSAQFMQEKKQTQAPLLFTSFSKFDGKIDSLITQKTNLKADSSIELSHQIRFFTLEFALADFANSSQNNYTYQLEGFEPDWSKPSNNNVARYYNIPAGNYTFKVKASAIGENWNKQILEIPIRVREAFYNTWWFLLTALAVASALVLGLFRYRIYRIEQGRKKLEEEVQIRTQELALEKEKSDKLLLNILPAETAEELKQYGKAKAKRYEKVTVFFSDFKGFSTISKQLEPEELVAEIDLCFRTFDEIMEMYGLEKIKTIGDAYMCAGGISNTPNNAAEKVVQAALEIQAYMAAHAFEKKDRNEPYFEARIGIHTGSVVAGIVGIKKFAYDIWGDTVNIAARMEGNGEVGRVNISEATYQLVKDKFECTPRGKINIKNQGEVDMYFVDGKI